MNNNKIAIENFIEYCDDMMITEEGLFKNFIARRHEKKERKRRKREKDKKEYALLYKYSEKYIVPQFDKISNKIKKYIEKECAKENIKAKITFVWNTSENDFLEVIFNFSEGYYNKFFNEDAEDDTYDICNAIVKEAFLYIKKENLEFYEMMNFDGDYGGPGNFGFEIDLNLPVVEKYLEKFNDFKKEREELENEYSDIK